MVPGMAAFDPKLPLAGSRFQPIADMGVKRHCGHVTSAKQIKFYRDKAQEMRNLAKSAGSSALREKLEEVAREYDRLANEMRLANDSAQG